MKNIYNAPNKESAAMELDNLEKKWIQPIHNWGLIMNQFILIFEKRIQIYEIIPESCYLIYTIFRTLPKSSLNQKFHTS